LHNNSVFHFKYFVHVTQIENTKSEKYEDTQGVTRSPKSKEDRQHNGKIKIKTIKVQINNVNTHPFTVCYFMGGDKLRFGMYNYHTLIIHDFFLSLLKHVMYSKTRKCRSIWDQKFTSS
jgi:hypothetical protein